MDFPLLSLISRDFLQLDCGAWFRPANWRNCKKWWIWNMPFAKPRDCRNSERGMMADWPGKDMAGALFKVNGRKSSEGKALPISFRSCTSSNLPALRCRVLQFFLSAFPVTICTCIPWLSPLLTSQHVKSLGIPQCYGYLRTRRGKLYPSGGITMDNPTECRWPWEAEAGEVVKAVPLQDNLPLQAG